MHPNDSRTPMDNLRPESQPHGTTEDQIHEMESEGQGAKAAAKPKSTPARNRTPDPNVLLRTEPCDQCGELMLWTQNVWMHGDSHAAAYRCLNGHVLDPHTTHQCPRCGVHDTHPIASLEDGFFACNRCENRFEIAK